MLLPGVTVWLGRWLPRGGGDARPLESTASRLARQAMARAPSGKGAASSSPYANPVLLTAARPPVMSSRISAPMLGRRRITQLLLIAHGAGMTSEPLLTAVPCCGGDGEWGCWRLFRRLLAQRWSAIRRRIWPGRQVAGATPTEGAF